MSREREMQAEAFLNTPVWGYMAERLTSMRQDTLNDLVTDDRMRDPLQIGLAQQRIRLIDEILEMPGNYKETQW